ncbi:MAG: hypothetical protein JOZ62_21815 [Acidobacteriaceae bacterium]|nr:hypothetical protein [Acidobacteriaceae bacterium]
MKTLRFFGALLLLGALHTYSWAQSSGGSPQIAGVENSAQVKTTVRNLASELQQAKAPLTAINPQQWYDVKGAPGTYITQWHQAQTEVDSCVRALSHFSNNTGDLAEAMDVYFRLEMLDTTLRSLADGAARYADANSAGQLSAVAAHNFNARERLRDYLRELATSVQQDYKLADAEAQRCRAMISREPANTKRSKN